MKKLFKVSIAVLLLVAMTASIFAAPKKKAKDKKKAAAAAEPTYYVLDVYDACTELKIVPNQYAEAGKTDFQ